MKKDKLEKIVALLIFIIIFATSIYFSLEKEKIEENTINNIQISYEITDIPKYSGDIYVTINNNIPRFSEEDMKTTEDYYSNLEDGRVRNCDDKN